MTWYWFHSHTFVYFLYGISPDCMLLTRSRCSLANAVTALGAGQGKNLVSVPGLGKLPDLFWSPRSVLFIGHPKVFHPRYCVQCVKLTEVKREQCVCRGCSVVHLTVGRHLSFGLCHVYVHLMQPWPLQSRIPQLQVQHSWPLEVFSTVYKLW